MAKENETTRSLYRWLNVIKAIAGDQGQSAASIAEILGSSTRNAYYVLNALEKYGFMVNHTKGSYSLDINSPFFRELRSSVNFTTDQAAYLYKLLLLTGKDNALAGTLMVKLERFYHLNGQDGNEKSYGPYKNYLLLKRAIHDKKCVVLHNYASSNSLTVRDRFVEPFMFLGEESDIRAYEPESSINKTFKISRISSVDILEDDWSHEEKHRDAFTDMFMYSGEIRHHIRLRLDVSSSNFMQEEYPHSEACLTREDDTHWLLETDVANYAGIGRFILGLYDHIEIIEDEGLQQYLRQQIQKMLDR